MKFDDADTVDQLCYTMKLADYPRAQNRARINDLMNGVPPYTDEEVKSNNINVNCNFLEATSLAHDARSQFYQAFLKPGQYFNAILDSGPKHLRHEWSDIVTRAVNRIMKRSLLYTECLRSKFASNVLHGIAPAVFRDADGWCPDPKGVEDVLVPANTLLTMRNLPFFPIYHSYTAPELIAMTRGPNIDPAWNLDLVNACLEWVDQEMIQLMGSNWPEVWSPEKVAERVKGDGGFYSADNAPTIDCWDLYFWNDEGKTSGWNRRMILDAWSNPNASGTYQRKSQKPFRDYRNQFLYNPGNRKYAHRREEIINWQFADLSAVSPPRYHSVRSLGFLTYAVCHLQNRLRCKINESVFEALCILFRVKGLDDVNKALKLDLIHRGFVDETINFLPPQERYQVNEGLVQLGLSENYNLISRHSSSYTTQPQAPASSKEKTAFQVMTETQAMTSLVSAALMQAYLYQEPEYREIFRRFCKKDSSDPEVKEFQTSVLRQGVPEEMLEADRWDITPEKVMGAGNKTLEMTIANWLMERINLYDPESQGIIKRVSTLAVTDDPALTDTLVPKDTNRVNNFKHDAQLAVATILRGQRVETLTGANHVDYIETWLSALQVEIQRAMQKGGMASLDEIMGMENLGQHIQEQIGIVAQDKGEAERVKQYGDMLGKLMNEVRAFLQRLQQQMKKQAATNGGVGVDQQTMAKIQAMIITANAKASNTKEAHAQRTAQRQLAWQMEQQRKQKEFDAEMQRRGLETSHELQSKAAHTGLELQREKAKTVQELGHESVRTAQDLAHQRLKNEEELRKSRRKPKATEE